MAIENVLHGVQPTGFDAPPSVVLGPRSHQEHICNVVQGLFDMDKQLRMSIVQQQKAIKASFVDWDRLRDMEPGRTT